MSYTTAVWNVKQGGEDEFVRIWQQMAESVPSEHSGMIARLLRDLEKPSRFVSVASPWRSSEPVAEALASQLFSRRKPR